MKGVSHIIVLVYMDVLRPTGSMIALLKLNYIYILAFLCVAVICIVPLVAFPVVVSESMDCTPEPVD